MALTTQQSGLTKESFMEETRQMLLDYFSIKVTDKELLKRWIKGDNVSNAISYFLLHK
jgi:hypothetical protein